MSITQLEAWHRAYDAALQGGDDHEGAIRDADWAAATCPGAIIETRPGTIVAYNPSPPRYWPDRDEQGIPIPWAGEVNRQNQSRVAS